MSKQKKLTVEQLKQQVNDLVKQMDESDGQYSFIFAVLSEKEAAGLTTVHVNDLNIMANLAASLIRANPELVGAILIGLGHQMDKLFFGNLLTQGVEQDPKKENNRCQIFSE